MVGRQVSTARTHLQRELICIYSANSFCLPKGFGCILCACVCVCVYVCAYVSVCACVYLCVCVGEIMLVKQRYLTRIASSKVSCA